MEFAAYYRPTTLEELYAALRNEPADALFLAGGTDVLVQNRAGGNCAGRAVFDLTALDALRQLHETADTITLGACVTHGQAAESALLRQYAPPLCAGCRQVGAVQLRNRATIGGNIANASPAGDTLGPLAALDASVAVDHLGERRCIPVTELIERPGQLRLGEREFIREIRIPKLPSGWQWRFRKVGRRQALAISRLTLTLLLKLEGGGVIASYRAAVGAVFPQPMRFPDWERQFLGQQLSGAVAQEMARTLADKIPEIAGVRPSTRYKQPVAQLLCSRLLQEMLAEYLQTQS